MSRYSRKSHIYYDKYQKTRVSIHWSNKASAYAIHFEKLPNSKWFAGGKERFQKIQTAFIGFINNLPYGEKEKVIKIDIVNNEEVQDWTYYIHEKHLNNFRNLVELMPEDFEIDFIEKPDETARFTSKFIPIDVWLDKFKEITGESISNLDYNGSRSIYRRMCRLLHPDYNPNDLEIASKMSELNEIWTNLEIYHFKTKQIEQLQEV